MRDAGAVPATIGIVDGRFVVGMDAGLVDRFASSQGIPKVSARDLGPVLARGGLGATTVAGTVVLAARAGIPVFSTAGIGGVHRRAQETFDVSADLLQFTRTRIAVVCAGAKSILDLGLTAEYLETAGVPVLGYGTDRLPDTPTAFLVITGCFAVTLLLAWLLHIGVERPSMRHWSVRRLRGGADGPRSTGGSKSTARVGG